MPVIQGLMKDRFSTVLLIVFVALLIAGFMINTQKREYLLAGGLFLAAIYWIIYAIKAKRDKTKEE